MRELLLLSVVVLLVLLVAMAIVSLVRGALRGWPKSNEPYEPVLDPYTPRAVSGSRWLASVGLCTLIWGAINLSLALWWTLTRIDAPSAAQSPAPSAQAVTISAMLLGGYLLVAAVLGLWGSVQLLRHRPSGRRLISWGHFLMGIMAFLGAVYFMMAPGQTDSVQLRAAAPYLAIALAVHLLIDVTLGTAAQQVARPGHPRHMDLKPVV